ncbi:MAG: TetR/AcrR family transcriptional regulator [Spirochaetaceae bacterium]|nr:TetR/AcrR family transcriptional regulator [Myxococcales bacterium]MCB9724847.1 TetR/AcrR family transcriptional regulator [Spirochaetaceae bacterium]HPG25884.1 TetR/AcrR family transcriptional regulator [Myxococcota bacterium]
MRNNVPRLLAPQPDADGDRSGVPSAIAQTVDRSLLRRRAAAQDEVERLVRAAFTLIERTGGLDPRVSDILAEAGLSNQAFYRHFRSKHELLVAVLDEGIRGLADYLGTRMAGTSSASDAVRAWIRGMAAQATDAEGAQATRPFALARGRLAETFPAEVARSATQLTAPLRAALVRARDAGLMPAVDPAAEAEALYLLMMGWVEARLIEGRIPTREEVDRLEAFAMAGLERAAQPATTGDEGRAA